MEPAGTKVRCVIYTHVKQIKELSDTNFVHFDGSHEFIHLDKDMDLAIGDKVKITFEKVDNANT